VPALEDEIKPMDIRSSVVWTGKIPEHLKKEEAEKDHELNQEEEKKEENNIGKIFYIIFGKSI